MKKLVFALFILCAAAVVGCFALNNQLKHARKEIKTIVFDPEILQEKLSKKPPEWMVRQIQKDLAPYAAGISREVIDGAFNGKVIESNSLVRFTIKDSHIAFALDEKHLYARHFKELLACIRKLNEQVKLPDVDFIVSLEDGFGGNPGIGPCFVFAKNERAEGLVLIPDINAIAGYSKLRAAISEANRKFAWDQKVAKTFWRGASTGGYLTKATWERLARAQLVLLSLAHPELLDARFNKIVQAERGVRELLKGKGMVGSSLPQKDHLKYKYLVDVDGNSCSYERYFWLLLSNSLVLKQVTQNVQWYYGGLEPYKHFLPVKEDLSDLVEKIQWAKGHDEECRLMAQRATEFVRENLAPEDTLLYFYLLLKEYAQKQKFLL
jgi:hypothetical protein